MRIFGIIILCLGAIFLFIFACLFSSIKKAIIIVECSALFCTQVCSVIFSPLVLFLLCSGFFAYWFIVSLYVFSSGEIIHDPTNPYANINWNKGVKRTLTFFLFCLFWNSGLFIAINQFVASTAASYWYFSHRPQ